MIFPLIPVKANYIKLAAWIFVLLTIGLAIAGGWRSYSPVPFWDMWDGTLDFYLRLNDGRYSEWWTQHNEHRIVLSRLLFLVDLKWFSGVGLFLIAINYLLVGLGAFLFFRILRNRVATVEDENGQILLGLFITAWLFLWMQNENLIWGFQSQFILAQLLPLWALFILYKSLGSTKADMYFIVACILGVASVGTMANGILALPLMVLYALCTRQTKLRIGLLFCLGTVSIFFYFFNYHSPAQHGSLIKAARETPVELIEYILLYLGSPFYYLFGSGHFGFIAAICAGIILITGSFSVVIGLFRKRDNLSLDLVLLCFILYIFGTALGTAGGRLIFGVSQALSSRYATPALMAWSALFVLYSRTILLGFRKRGILYFLVGGLISFFMISLQIRALDRQDEMVFERKLGALALALQVHDQSRIARVAPDMDFALMVSSISTNQRISIFGIYPFLDVLKDIGSTLESKALPICAGNLDTVESIEGEKVFLRIRGWIYSPIQENVPEFVRIGDARGNIIGYAITGQVRQDVFEKVSRKATLSGFQGYILLGEYGSAITMTGEKPSCVIHLNIPAFPYTISSVKPSSDLVTVGMDDVENLNQWTGADYDRSASLSRLNVFGSYIQSDSDMGSISVKIKRGDSLLYRSGPTGGRQFLDVFGSGRPSTILPVSTEWSVLNFNSKLLPDGKFTIKFSDNGANWGEWSAIAVKKSDF